jgi:hypothetical protein
VIVGVFEKARFREFFSPEKCTQKLIAIKLINGCDARVRGGTSHSGMSSEETLLNASQIRKGVAERCQVLGFAFNQWRDFSRSKHIVKVKTIIGLRWTIARLQTRYFRIWASKYSALQLLRHFRASFFLTKHYSLWRTFTRSRLRQRGLSERLIHKREIGLSGEDSQSGESLSAFSASMNHTTTTLPLPDGAFELSFFISTQCGSGKRQPPQLSIIACISFGTRISGNGESRFG